MKELDIIPREQHETSKNYAKRILIHNILTFRLEPGEQFQDKVKMCIRDRSGPESQRSLPLCDSHYDRQRGRGRDGGTVAGGPLPGWM